MRGETGKYNFSQTRAMLAITRASLRSILRSPSAVVFILVFPLVFILVFGFIGGNKVRLELGLYPGSDTGSVFFHEISSAPGVRILSGKTKKEIDELLIKGRVDAAIFIDTAGGGVQLYHSKTGGDQSKLLQTIASGILIKERLFQTIDSTGRISISETPLLQSKVVEAREYKTIDFILPGQLGFSILSAGVFGTAFVFFSLRQTMVMKRFFATPIKRIYIIFGEALSRLIFQLAGAVIIILLGRCFFGFTLINGLLTVIHMLILSALGLMVFMGFGFVVSGIAKSESVIPPISNIVTLPQFLLSGTFFPVDAFPDWLQPVSRFLPLTYLNDALRKVAFEGVTFSGLWLELSVISLWGIVIYIAAVRFFRWE
ncbi:MAG: ABC transporter permease [Bacteroidetes bacterium]|nr:MAG: ABC transporter permease [Bacteroidota bacterium]REK00748.1 MAG: ABC transporter permease [Bacteroidota bacterium]REK34996.1 MAG: ABC transporter permease [Bacteroidota bacterium]REK48206.1 MAG: ABC transporter permease [Bacteroidota bacterium]